MASSDIFDYLLKSTCEWLRGTGAESDIVLSSRIRLARNIANFPFTERLTPAEQDNIIKKVETAVDDLPILKKSFFVNFKGLDETDREFLLERHLISREHAAEGKKKAVVISPNEVISVMVLEEDHLRSQVFQSGLNLLEAWRLMDQLDTALENELTYAFQPNLGYLTACPTNVGTGMRASCMVHLVGLVMTKQIGKVVQALLKLNLAARGFLGEGTEAAGNFYQFSNQQTLGQREEEIVENLERVMKQVVEHEKEARNHLLEKKRGQLEDQIWRAVGTLKSSRLMTSGEAIGLLSLMRLGVDLGLVQNLGKANLNALFLFIQPAHLQKLMGGPLSAGERDQKRAELLRTRLKDVDLL